MDGPPDRPRACPGSGASADHSAAEEGIARGHTMEQCDGVLGAKRWSTFHRAVQRGAEGEHIRGEVRLTSSGNFGSEIGRRAVDHPARGQGRIAQRCAIPKSLINAVPSSAIRTLPGLTSRWTMPTAWARLRAPTRPAPPPSLLHPVAAVRPCTAASVMEGMNCMISHSWPSCSTTSNTGTA